MIRRITGVKCLRPTARLKRRSIYSLQVFNRCFSGNSANDATLRKVFDCESAWRDFNSSKMTSYTGLFDNKRLNSAQSINEFTNDSYNRAQQMVEEILSSESPEELKSVIRKLDILSDTICKVIDMVAFIRMSHPNPKFVRAAEQSHEAMFNFMNFLNTSVELHNLLEKVLGNPDIFKALSSEEKVVGQVLLSDFKKSGVNLEPLLRQKFVDYANQIIRSGHEFAAGVTEPFTDSLQFSTADVYGMDPSLVKSLKSFGGKISIPTSGPVCDLALQTITDEEVRKELWLAQRSTSQGQKDMLKHFLQARAQLAGLTGRKSFAEYELSDKMAKSPDNVNRFLIDLIKRLHPRAKSQLDNLAKMKADNSKSQICQQLQPWDRDYYYAKYMYAKRSKRKTADFLPAYFSLGTVIQGLSRLFTSIYGIRFEPAETKPGEVWAGSVRKLNVVSETEGRVGVIYCDLFQRIGKSPNPAHFTVQCSREILPNELHDDLHNESSVITTSDGSRFQLPIIALICNFVRNEEYGLCLLTFSELETLFHEMGHAIHSMLGRTKLHNVSGTRCATDFVELPSVLMEHFAASPKVLGLFARHYQTDEPLPIEALESHLYIQSLLNDADTYHQVLMSLLDQQLHSEVALDDNFDPGSIYYELEKQYGLFPAQKQSSWYAQFGHLFGYGATYYCYLFDRAISDRIWHKLFKADPLSRQAGETFKNEVLAWGGSRDPWLCVARALNEPELERGDENAMLKIGESLEI